MRVEVKAKKPLLLWEKSILASPCFKHICISCTNNTSYNAIVSRTAIHVQKHARLSKKANTCLILETALRCSAGPDFPAMLNITVSPPDSAGPMKSGDPEMTAHLQHVGHGCHLPCCPMPHASQVEKRYLPERNLLNFCLFKEIKNHWSRLETLF